MIVYYMDSSQGMWILVKINNIFIYEFNNN